MRHVLISYHGTIVYYDTERQMLRHGPVVDAPDNVTATFREGSVLLSWRDGDVWRPLGDFGPEGCALAMDGAPALLHVQLGASGLSAFHAAGRYLCAEVDGSVAMSRHRPGEWEHFLALDVNDFSALRFVLGNRWLVHRTGAVVGPGETACGAAWLARVGHIRLPIVDLAAAARTDRGTPRELWLRYDGWKVERLTLYRPLAYLVAYGHPDIFDCAEIAIRSLFDHAEWTGDVLVITDAAHLDFVSRFQADGPTRVLGAVIPAHDVLDFTLARYRIGDIPLACGYQPVLYMDTDVVCDAPLHGVLRDAVRSSALHGTPEWSLDHGSDYYGASLLMWDGVEIEPETLGYSSGVFLFRHVDDQRAAFGHIVNAAYQFAMGAARRDAFECYDQPFFNYVLCKAGHASGALLRDVVLVKPNHIPQLTAPAHRGMVHFSGGVGNTVPKLQQMTEYIAMLGPDAPG